MTGSRIMRLSVAALAAATLLGASRWTDSRAAPVAGTPIHEAASAGTASTSLPGDNAENEQNSRRLREGTVLEGENGFFQLDGDGATFVTSEGYQFGGLPNLNLERVVRTLKGAEEASEVQWSVSGVVTEFGNRNYLLIRRAVYKSVARPPVPEAIIN